MIFQCVLLNSQSSLIFRQETHLSEPKAGGPAISSGPPGPPGPPPRPHIGPTKQTKMH